MLIKYFRISNDMHTAERRADIEPVNFGGGAGVGVGAGGQSDIQMT